MAEETQISAHTSGEALIGTGIPAELADARGTIDNIDAALVHILAERFRRLTRHVKHDRLRVCDRSPKNPASTLTLLKSSLPSW